MCEKLNLPSAISDEETLGSAYLEALPARMTHLSLACGDFTRLTLAQLQAYAEASALGEHLQGRKLPNIPDRHIGSQGATAGSQESCFECGADDLWAKDCSHRLGKVKLRRNGEPRAECKICRKRGHDAHDCWFKGMRRCKRCHGFGHPGQDCRVSKKGIHDGNRTCQSPTCSDALHQQHRNNSSVNHSQSYLVFEKIGSLK